jgi:hypothetical protein
MTRPAAGSRRARLQREIDRHVVSRTQDLRAPRLRLLGYVQSGRDALPVYLVSGELVRNTIDIDFTQGGNEAAYPSYVPKREIWIDDAMHTLDRIATTFHEITERNMVLYQGIDYDRAHDIACQREIVLRRDLRLHPPRAFDVRLVARALEPFAREAYPQGKRPGKPSRIV